jgi:hypothetical protein
MVARITDTSDGQYVQLRGYVISNAGPTTGPFVSTDTCQAGPAAAGKVVVALADLNFAVIPVNAAADTETLTTGLPGLVAVAWQADDIDADRASVFVSDIATGEVTFDEAETGSIEGYIWCWYRG